MDALVAFEFFAVLGAAVVALVVAYQFVESL